MKRKMFGAASVAMAAAALSMPAGAQAQVADVKMCGPTLQACVIGVVNSAFTQVNFALQTTMDVVEAVCDFGTSTGCSMPVE